MIEKCQKLKVQRVDCQEKKLKIKLSNIKLFELIFQILIFTIYYCLNYRSSRFATPTLNVNPQQVTTETILEVFNLIICLYLQV